MYPWECLFTRTYSFANWNLITLNRVYVHRWNRSLISLMKNKKPSWVSLTNLEWGRRNVLELELLTFSFDVIRMLSTNLRILEISSLVPLIASCILFCLLVRKQVTYGCFFTPNVKCWIGSDSSTLKIEINNTNQYIRVWWKFIEQAIKQNYFLLYWSGADKLGWLSNGRAPSPQSRARGISDRRGSYRLADGTDVEQRT